MINIPIKKQISALLLLFLLSFSLNINIALATPPLIIIAGDSPVEVDEGDTYVDAGVAIAQDSIDGNLINEVVTDNPVNTSMPGTYTITYSVTNSQDETSSTTRTVIVLDASVDTTPPVIIINGAGVLGIDQGTTYVDAGFFIAQDDVDGDLSSQVVTVNPVDTAIPDTYYVTYSATDSSGNTGIATRTVIVYPVEDTTPPVLILNGDATVEIDQGDTYNDLGLMVAQDNIDGDMMGEVVTVNPVNTSIPDTYYVTYSATDTAGNTATATRTVIVSAVGGDTTPPVLILNGAATVEIDQGDTYNDLGLMVAQDNIDGDMMGEVVTVNPVNTSIPDTYYVTYSATDTAGNTATATRTVIVNAVASDTTPPVLILNGAATVEVDQGDTYNDLGLMVAQDDVDGDIMGEVVTVNPVNTSIPDTYYVTYSATDSSGNTATATRTVIVVDAIPPSISLQGDNPFNHERATVYVDPGASSTDNIDGDLSANISVDLSALATSTLGSYEVYYTVSDAVGNTQTATRTVNVIDTTAPVRSSGSGGGTLSAGTSNTNITLTTNEEAICHISGTANRIYASSTEMSVSSSTSHSHPITGLSNGSSYTYYIRCADASGNENSDDYTINFSVANPTSTGGGGGGGGGGGSSYTPPKQDVDGDYAYPVTELSSERTATSVVISWTNPVDARFEKTVVIRSTEPIDSYITYSAMQGLGETVYEGSETSFVDSDVEINKNYYYAIFTVDEYNNSSEATIIEKKSTIVQDEESSENEVAEVQNSGQVSVNYGTIRNLAGVPSDVVEVVSRSDAQIIYYYNNRVDLNETTNRLYLFIATKSPEELSEQDKYAIAYYIHEGSQTTKILGAGERAGVLNSYLTVFDKLPNSEEEWQDVVKIANGRWPTERNLTREGETEATTFASIYRRSPDMNNPHDNAAVTVITYGLRPADRNMDSEKAAIKIYRGIFGTDPVEASDWDIVRAIAYSGAVR